HTLALPAPTRRSSDLIRQRQTGQAGSGEHRFWLRCQAGNRAAAQARLIESQTVELHVIDDNFVIKNLRDGERRGDAFGSDEIAQDRKSTRLNSSHVKI